MKYNLIQIEDGGEANLTVVHDGEMYVATNTHPNFARIVAGVTSGDESVVSLFDVQKTAQKRFDRLSERVTIASGKVYLDGEEVDNALTQQVVNFVDAGVEDFKPLVNFFEKIETNPNDHSRVQLYRWLADRNITITDEGNFIAYKGVNAMPDNDGGMEYYSISRGKAVSDGVSYDGEIPNPIGAIVEMPRGEVQHDPSVGCHKGLHAGTWSYASNFARGAVLTVEINPRDVVSVPTDCQDQKIRVCRYKVLDVTDTELDVTVYSTYPSVDGYEDDVDESDDFPEVEDVTKASAVTWHNQVSSWDATDPEAPWNQ